jgi:hypothetical protein
MKTGLVSGIPAVVIAGSDVNFAAHDGLNAALPGCFVKFDHAVHIAVVCDGKAAHAEFPGPVYQRNDAAASVKQTVLGMNVKVGKHTARPEIWYKIITQVF